LTTCLLQVVPRTTRIVEQIFEATSMTSGNIKFSKLDAGTHMYERSSAHFLMRSIASRLSVSIFGNS
jgi:hypothetical protein